MEKRAYFNREGGCLVRASKYATPETTPIAKPAKPKNSSPKRLSSHCPPTPGKTIIAATARILDTHSIASVIGEGRSGGTFTAS
jgi:hypothetical protein